AQKDIEIKKPQENNGLLDREKFKINNLAACGKPKNVTDFDWYTLQSTLWKSGNQ
ncbi:5573_t:CDS:2, partial [Entrophospora sp. SA101]